MQKDLPRSRIKCWRRFAPTTKPAMAASGGPTRAAFSEATDLFRFRAIPGVEVSTKLFMICEGCRYDITSVEDVKGRGMYVEILAKKVVAANG